MSKKHYCYKNEYFSELGKIKVTKSRHTENDLWIDSITLRQRAFSLTELCVGIVDRCCGILLWDSNEASVVGRIK